MISDLIREHDVRIPVRLISKDRYLVGTKVRLAVIQNNTVTFREGGGFMSFVDYNKKYGETETGRIKLKIVQSGSDLDALVN